MRFFPVWTFKEIEDFRQLFSADIFVVFVVNEIVIGCRVELFVVQEIWMLIFECRDDFAELQMIDECFVIDYFIFNDCLKISVQVSNPIPIDLLIHVGICYSPILTFHLPEVFFHPQVFFFIRGSQLEADHFIRFVNRKVIEHNVSDGSGQSVSFDFLRLGCFHYELLKVHFGSILFSFSSGTNALKRLTAE